MTLRLRLLSTTARFNYERPLPSDPMEGKPPPLPDLPPITRYVAPESGDNEADGLTPATAWRNLPGDGDDAPLHTIQPGDHIAVKGGEHYYLQDWKPPAGTAQDQIVISGNAWGTGRCQLVGALSNLCNTRLPTNAADAGNHPDWDNGEIVVVEWDYDDPLTQLFDDYGAGMRAQYPRPKNRYQYNDNFNQPSLYIDLPNGQTRNIVDDAKITDSGLADLLRADVLAGRKAELWVNRSPNQYQKLDVVGVSNDDVLLSPWPSGLNGEPYSTNKNLRPIIRDRVTDVTLPGDWCLMGPRKAIWWQREGGGTVQRAIGQDDQAEPVSGRVMQPAAYLTFRGFDMRHHTISTGKALVSWTGGLGRFGFQFIDNIVRDCVANTGASAIDVHGLSEVLVSHNRLYNLGRMGGILALGADGEICWNVIHDVNATGLRHPESDGHRCKVYRNILSRARGVHANGQSVYQTSDEVLSEYNAFIDCPRPFVTQQGGGKPDQVVSSRILRHSLLKCVDTEGTTPVRVDGSIRALTLEHCLMIGPDRTGLPVPSFSLQPSVHISKSAQNVTVRDCFMTVGYNGIVISYEPDNADTYVFKNNDTVSLDYLKSEQANATLKDDLIDVTFPDNFRLLIDLREVATK